MTVGYICYKNPTTNEWESCTQNFVRFSTEPRITVTVDQYEAEDTAGRLALDALMNPFNLYYLEQDPHEEVEY